MRLRGHGGTTVEEMATKRKQKQNLETLGNNTLGNNQLNSFAILNNIEDESLLQTAKELDI
jgi:hypothetical protein